MGGRALVITVGTASSQCAEMTSSARGAVFGTLRSDRR
jgi:hypothetical protein